MTAKIYFWKHGFQTDGVSLWIVQCERKRFFCKEVNVYNVYMPMVSRFQNKNPHAFFEVEFSFMVFPTTYKIFTEQNAISGKNHIYNKIVIS